MVLNDALKRHKRCLAECAEKHEICEIKPPRVHDCEEKRDACKIDCDFDYAPN